MNLKCRAWSYNDAKMYYVDYGKGSLETNGRYWAVRDHSDAIKATNGDVLMQCTGKTDDEGKEIYHNTVIEFEFVWFNGNYTSEMRKGVVKWSDSHLAFVISNNIKNDYYGADLIYFGEAYLASGITNVLGNIHNNPELLEEGEG